MNTIQDAVSNFMMYVQRFVSENPTLFIVGVVALVAIIALASWWRERMRRKAFAEMARTLGLTFKPHKNRGLAKHYGFIDKIAQGSQRYVFNLMYGDYRGYHVAAFDYHYATHSTDSKGRRRTHHHYLSFATLRHPMNAPELHIKPEGFFSKVGQALGFDDIDFESVEFSRAFVVKGQDKRFAYDICNARMMEFLLDHKDLMLEFERDIIALVAERRFKVGDIPGRLDLLVQIPRLIPDYVYQREGAGAPS